MIRAVAAAGFVALSLLSPAAVPAAELPPDADRLFWCASAFFWLAGSAADSGEVEEAGLYDAWASELTASGSALLHSRGFAPERIEALIAQYDQTVLEELAAQTGRHEVTTCPDLVKPPATDR